MSAESQKRASAKWYEKNAEKIREARRKKYPQRAHLEYETHKLWVSKNRERRAAYMRRWREERAEHRKTYDTLYRETHKEQRSNNENARRARKSGNGGSHTQEQWLSLQEAYEFRCAYCKAEVKLTKDHALPLARGGTDNIENIVPACLPCNRRKSMKTPEEFACSRLA